MMTRRAFATALLAAFGFCLLPRTQSKWFERARATKLARRIMLHNGQEEIVELRDPYILPTDMASTWRSCDSDYNEET